MLKNNKKAKILIAEDNLVSAMLLSEILRKEGFQDIHHCINGADALEEITSKTGSGKDYDLLITDLKMPVLSGYELCKKVRADAKFDNMPIIALTATSNEQERLAIFDCGASDLITKPMNQKEVLARVNVHLERKFLFNNLQQQKILLEEELMEAAEMQYAITPSKQRVQEISAKYNIKIAHEFIASGIIGGDFWGFAELGDDKLAVYIADFSGHGVRAAFNTFRLHTIMHQLNCNLENPDEYLRHLNNKLYDLINRGQFATMFYGVIDFTANTLKYAAAGTTAPILIRADKSIEILSGAGFPLAVRKDSAYSEIEVGFCKGDSLFLCSDGLLEANNQENQMFGEEVLSKLIEKTACCSGKELADAIMDKFKKFTGNNFADDVTLNIYQRI